MPYVAKKAMEGGPHLTAVQLLPGDEVPTPFNRNRIPHFIVEVDEVEGKRWADQPREAQDAWAALHELPPTVHPTQMVEAPAPALSESQEVAGADSATSEKAPAPPIKKRRTKKKTSKRG